MARSTPSAARHAADAAAGKKPVAAAAAADAHAGAEEQRRRRAEDEARRIVSVRDVAPRARWDPEGDPSLSPHAGGTVRADLAELVGQLGRGQALEDLCVTLRGGGYEVAEALCEIGAVEAALALFAPPVGTPAADHATRRLASEALWLMMYDHESCQRLIQADGHDRVVRLLKDQGPADAAVSGGALRLLGETLYSEARGAPIWATGDLDLLIEALDWALRSDPVNRPVLVATVCNIAALWVWRARDSAIEAALPLVGLIPRLLEELSEHPEDAQLLEQGCRLFHALAGRSRFWPENIREPTRTALMEISRNYRFQPIPGVHHAFTVHALKAVEALPCEPKPRLVLSDMD